MVQGRTVAVVALLCFTAGAQGSPNSTTLVTNADGSPLTGSSLRLSADGRTLTFLAPQSGLFDDDDGSTLPIPRHILYDLESGELRLLGNSLNSTAAGQRAAATSADGRFVAFTSIQHALDPVVPDPFRGELVFVLDRDTGENKAMPRNIDGDFPDRTRGLTTRFPEGRMAVGPDGRWVVLYSEVPLTGSGSSDAMFAYDRVAEQAVRLSPSLGVNTHDLRRPRFLDDGRLVATLPLESTKYDAFIFAAPDAPPEPMFPGRPSNIAADLVDYVTPDGRFAFVQQVESVTGHRTTMRVDTASGQRTRVCTATPWSTAGDCGVASASRDGRYILTTDFGNSFLVDEVRQQAVRAGLSAPALSPDGTTLYGYNGQALVKRVPQEVTLRARVSHEWIRTVTDRSDEDLPPLVVHVVHVDYALDNLGTSAATNVDVGLLTSLTSGPGVEPTVHLYTDHCTELVHGQWCTIPVLAGGETFRARITHRHVSGSRYNATLRWDAPEDFKSEPFNTEERIEFERPPEPVPVPEPPPPSGGSGNFGWWVLPLAAFAVRRVFPRGLLAGLQLARPSGRQTLITQKGAHWAPVSFDWRPQGDSNPCYRRERAVS